jgi:tetratricopeptide (TPR) repeat protein
MMLNVQGGELCQVAEFDSAMKVFRKALAIAESSRLTQRMAASYMNMGNAYEARSLPDPRLMYEPASTINRKADQESAAICYDSAISICLASNDSGYLASTYAELGILYFRTDGRLAAAESAEMRALTIFRNKRMETEQAWALYHLGMIHGEGRKLKLAQSDFKEATDLFVKRHNREGEVLARDYYNMTSMWLAHEAKEPDWHRADR